MHEARITWDRRATNKAICLSKSLSKGTKQPLHGFVTYQKMQGQQQLAI
jgi:hypothetical protein